jgi:hypothetical protein
LQGYAEGASGAFRSIRPLNSGQIHDQSVARTPFRTVSEGVFSVVGMQDAQ